MGKFKFCHFEPRFLKFIRCFSSFLDCLIALIELLSPHVMPFPVSIGVSVAFIMLVLTCGKYIGQLPADGDEADLLPEKGIV